MFANKQSESMQEEVQIERANLMLFPFLAPKPSGFATNKCLS